MSESFVISRSSINLADRYRKDYGDLTGIIDSLGRVGIIHPFVLSRNPNNTYDLIAGGRRLAALDKMGVTEFHHGAILDGPDAAREGRPVRFGFLFKNEVPEDELREAELDENLYRLKPKWHEDVLAVADIHEIKRKKHGTNKWGQRQTADLLGSGYGLANVNYSLRLAKAIRAGDKEVLACATMSDGISLMIKRQEDKALAELHKRNASKMSAGSGVASFLDVLKAPTGGIKLGGTDNVIPFSVPQDEFANAMKALNVAAEPKGETVITVTDSKPVDAVRIPLSSMFFNGDFREVVREWPDASFDHAVSDIPYGIDMDNLDNVEDVKDEHDIQQNVELMRPFLEETFRLVKPGGFCVFFYDLDHHEKLLAWAKEIGWRTQDWPFIACKTSACKNQAPQYNRTKNYEVAMYLRRDEKTVLRKPCTTSWQMYDFAAERKLYNNPFAKPFALWKDIYDSIAFTGQSVIDLTVGEMSSSRAAVNCGLIPYGVELKQQHYLRGLEHMKAVYAVIHKSNVIFT